MTKKQRDTVDLIYSELKQHRKESAERHDGIDSRLRKVEETQGRFKGAIALLSFLGLSGLISLFKNGG